ncbi:MAG: MFS transporter [Parcubacteria group bacterium]
MSPRIFNKPLRILLSTNALVLIASAMFIPIYALYVEDIGGDLFDAGLTAAVYAAVAGGMTLISGRLTDKLKRKELMVVVGYVIVGVGFLLYTFANSLGVLIAIQAIVGLGTAIYAPAFDTLYSHNLHERRTGLQWGAWEAMDYFATAAGALLGGAIVTYLGFTAMFVMMSVFCFASAAYIFFLPKKTL